MVKLFIPIGIPASGKSVWAEAQEAVHISSDAIRKELWGSEEDQQHPEKVFEKMFKMTIETLRANCDCVYDATNLSAKRRINFIKEIRKSVPDVVIIGKIFATPFEVCVERDKLRARHVGYPVLKRMYKSFEMPCMGEGFDSIGLVRDLSLLEKQIYDLDFLRGTIDAAIDISQDNPHHRLTIGEHCLAAQRWAKTHWSEIVADVGFYMAYCVCKAALYHDVGKVYCKTFKDARGNKSSTAHFYGHENCGAYDFLAYDGIEETGGMYIALLISYHMVFFKDEKYQEKVHARLGEKMWKALEWLHKADLAAH